MAKTLFRLIWHGLAVIGLMSLLGGAYLGFSVLRSSELSVRQLAVKVSKKLGLWPEIVERATAPRPRFDPRHLEGTPTNIHPRVLFAGPEAVHELKLRYQNDANYRKRVDAIAAAAAPMAKVVRWVCAADASAGAEVIRHLEKTVLESPREQGNDADALEYALAYDFSADHPAWTRESRARVNLQFRKYLHEVLSILDGDSVSLWHSRTQLAATAWVVAAAMDPMGREDERLRARAQRHFLESVEALRWSGGWPEGYTYWINNRAFPFVAACLAQMHAVHEPSWHKTVQEVLAQVGLWMIHGTEPIGRFVLFGDSGPRNDLKDETQRVIDLVYLGTRVPVFRDYSRYLSGLNGEEGYYSAYRWGIPLFRGQTDADHGVQEALKDLSAFEGRLPKSAVFGKENGMGQVFMRSHWESEATFISFMAGHSFTHHGHYQAGHFTITKKVPLAITSGTYGGYTSPHRLNYYIRTVAANSLLVLRPEERVKPNRFFETNVADGGQRIVMPTGSAVTSLEDWRKNLGKGRHYEGGVITAYDDTDDRFVYVAADLTGAYNNTSYDDNGGGGKVAKVRRALVYLRDRDVLVVFDTVESVRPEYVKKWLLHGWSKPQTAQETLLRGTAENGISQSADAYALMAYQGAALEIHRVLPADGVIRKVGGVDYRYYVETDGDEKVLDGVNMVEGENLKPWFDAGLWRLELQPGAPRKDDQFLVVLKPRLSEAPEATVHPILVEAKPMQGVFFDGTCVLFNEIQLAEGRASYSVPASSSPVFHLVTNLPQKRPINLRVNDQAAVVQTNASGVLTFSTPAGVPSSIRLEWK